MPKISYLTIDDSPTNHTDQLTDWLSARGIPAVLFCIGSSYQDLHLTCQGMTQLPDPIIRAIQKGFVIGNHTWSHRRASTLRLDEIIEEIEKTEKVIDDLYRRAGRGRPAKLLRFPHIDRGTGGWIVDYPSLGEHETTIRELFGNGLNIKLSPPPSEWVDKKNRIQEYLAREGFTANIYPGVTFDWFTQTEMALARDHLYTFSTSDWMMNPDFATYNQDWAYHSLSDLKQKIENDPWLKNEQSANIVLAHDHNNMFDVTTSLIDSMVKIGISFREVKL